MNYSTLGYDITAVIRLKVKVDTHLTITKESRQYQQTVSVHEVTDDHDIIAILEFTDQIKSLLSNPDINKSNKSIVINSVSEEDRSELKINFGRISP